MDFKKLARKVAIPAGTFLAGAMLVAAGQGSTQQSTAVAAAPAPAPTVTVTPAPKVETKTVEKAPGACTEALGYADTGFDHAGTALGLMSEAVGAGARFDTATITAKTAELRELTPKIKTNRAAYDSAAAECRKAG